MVTPLPELFDGPLDALLGMVERGEIDPTEIAIVAVVRQYIALRIEHLDPALTADSIAMTARLMVLKSRALLPKPPPADPLEEDVETVQALLDEYRRFKAAASTLREREESGLRSFPRLAPPPSIPPGPGLSTVTLDRLAVLVQRALARITAEEVETVEREPITIRQKLDELEAILARDGVVSFAGFISGSVSKIDVVVGFLAVLELIRRGRAEAHQSELFGDIELRLLPAGPPHSSEAIVEDLVC